MDKGVQKGESAYWGKYGKPLLEYEKTRVTAEMSALSSGKINKYEYLTGKKMLNPKQRRIKKPAKFTYSQLGKKNKKKTIKEHLEKQDEALKSLDVTGTGKINEFKSIQDYE